MTEPVTPTVTRGRGRAPKNILSELQCCKVTQKNDNKQKVRLLKKMQL